MWSSDRRKFLALLSAGALGACGFTPTYGPGGGAYPLVNRVRIPEPDSGDSYVLVRELEQRLGRGGAPDYDLALKLNVSEQSLAVTSDSTTTRFNVVGTLNYSLTETATGTIIGSGRVNSFTGYSATGSTVATLASQGDAHERLMVILSDMLVARLTADVARAGAAAARPAAQSRPAVQ